MRFTVEKESEPSDDGLDWVVRDNLDKNRGCMCACHSQEEAENICELLNDHHENKGR